MKKISFNRDWNRKRYNANSLLEPDEITMVNLPDDFVIHTKRSAEAIGGAFTGYFEGGKAIYSKVFEMPKEWQDKTVMLYVDGAYMTSQVELNEEVIGSEAYGYAPYWTNLSPWDKKKNG